MTIRAAATTAARSADLLEMVRALVRSMRPRQWSKNAVVLVGLVFARELGRPDQVARAVVAAFLFCLLSGAVYLVNDLLDMRKDRLHPVKRLRPLAAGQLSPITAAAAAAAAPIP